MIDRKWIYVHPRATSYAHVLAIKDQFQYKCAYLREPFRFLTLCLRRLFSKNIPVVFGANFTTINFLVLLLLLLSRSPLILHFSSYRLPASIARIFRVAMLFSFWADVRVAYTTNAVKMHIERALGGSILSVRSEVVWHSSDLIVNIDEQIVGGSEREIDFVYFGRLEHVRGIDRFVDLARSLPQYQFAIAGNGEELEFVKFSCESLPNLKYAGYLHNVEHKREFLSDAKVMVSLMRGTENFGIAIIEGLSVGCVPVCPRDIGPLEILGSEYFGLFDKSENLITIKNICVKTLGMAIPTRLSPHNICRLYSTEPIRELWFKIL